MGRFDIENSIISLKNDTPKYICGSQEDVALPDTRRVMPPLFVASLHTPISMLANAPNAHAPWLWKDSVIPQLVLSSVAVDLRLPPPSLSAERRQAKRS